MNETIQTILKRRSVRSYKSEQPSKQILQELIDCGLFAPSAMNKQTWHFTVVQNTKLIHEMDAALKEVLPEDMKKGMVARRGENFHVFHRAPALIVVSHDTNDGGSVVNCSLATQNICLAAEALELGTCIIGFANILFESDRGSDFIKTLGIPEGYKILHTITVGYKDAGGEVAAAREDGRVNWC